MLLVFCGANASVMQPFYDYKNTQNIHELERLVVALYLEKNNQFCINGKTRC